MEEIIDLDIDGMEDIQVSDKPTFEFGGGVELLMNDKNIKAVKHASSLENDIEELNDLGSIKLDEPKHIPYIGQNTVNMTNNNNGFKKMHEINIDNDVKEVDNKTKEEVLKEKFNYLRKLEQLESKGVTLSKRYSMDSSLDEMKGEYETHITEKERTNSIKFQGKLLTTFITGVEYLNKEADPFNIKLDGWSEQVHETIEDYDDIFSELHEKYKSKANMSPEIKFLFQLASSGMMIHMTNTMFKSSIPGMDDIMRQNPDLMNLYTKAAVNSMETNAPGLKNFMNDFGSTKSGPSDFNTDNRPDRSDTREDMKGPENIDNLINQLHNNKINLDDNNVSTISVEDMENMSSTPVPSVRRKRKSDKNTISLAV